MPQIFDVSANENARYKRNELELPFTVIWDTAQDKFSKRRTSLILLSSVHVEF